MLVNAVAAILLIIIAPIAWPPAGLFAVGSILGGQLGASIGTRLPAPLLRILISVVGTIVGIRLLIG